MGAGSRDPIASQPASSFQPSHPTHSDTLSTPHTHTPAGVHPMCDVDLQSPAGLGGLSQASLLPQLAEAGTRVCHVGPRGASCCWASVSLSTAGALVGPVLMGAGLRVPAGSWAPPTGALLQPWPSGWLGLCGAHGQGMVWLSRGARSSHPWLRLCRPGVQVCILWFGDGLTSQWVPMGLAVSRKVLEGNLGWLTGASLFLFRVSLLSGCWDVGLGWWRHWAPARTPRRSGPGSGAAASLQMAHKLGDPFK